MNLFTASQVFGTYVLDSFLDVPSHTTVYESGIDKALGMSQSLLRTVRLGKAWQAGASDEARHVLQDIDDELSFVNVTETVWAAENNGYAYFRKRPWASSHVLMSLLHDLSPAERGLVKHEDGIACTFPDDYIQRLRSRLFEIYPAWRDESTSVTSP